jgi:hypothetical protein
MIGSTKIEVLEKNSLKIYQYNEKFKVVSDKQKHIIIYLISSYLLLFAISKTILLLYHSRVRQEFFFFGAEFQNGRVVRISIAL